jgi:Zn-finger nucleic acid-binding protein
MADEARALSCPSCGAPVTRGARLCAHCQGELATIRCGSCFSLEMAGANVCSRCATPLELEGMEGPLGIDCPRCGKGAALVGIRVGEHHAGECLACTGLFVEHAVLERITRRTEALGGLRLRPPVKHENAPDRTAYLPCPRCGAHMNRRGFGERSGVVVDVCAKHGVWFDRDELARAVEFVESGGLARNAERDRIAASIRRLHGDGRRVDAAGLEPYDMVASFLLSLVRDP